MPEQPSGSRAPATDDTNRSDLARRHEMPTLSGRELATTGAALGAGAETGSRTPFAAAALVAAEILFFLALLAALGGALQAARGAPSEGDLPENEEAAAAPSPERSGQPFLTALSGEQTDALCREGSVRIPIPDSLAGRAGSAPVVRARLPAVQPKKARPVRLPLRVRFERRPDLILKKVASGGRGAPSVLRLEASGLEGEGERAPPSGEKSRACASLEGAELFIGPAGSGPRAAEKKKRGRGEDTTRRRAERRKRREQALGQAREVLFAAERVAWATDQRRAAREIDRARGIFSAIARLFD